MGTYFQTQKAKVLRKASAAKAEPADKTLEREQPNPVWQSLAMAPAVLHPKLAISRRDDPDEREADEAVHEIMRMPTALDATASRPRLSPSRAATRQSFENPAVHATSSHVPAIVHAVLSSTGEPLDPTTRSFMEQRFNYDFGNVRVHTDWRAAESARALQALAYTVGRDVVFDRGRYANQTPEGFNLLTHELAHVVQQGNGGGHCLSRFEARVHESIERYGLTTTTGGGTLTNEEASAVYFGNWMRDLNQVFVPMVQSVFPDDVMFSLISYLAARKFGRELTPDQFGYYIPAEHIDSPAGLITPPVREGRRVSSEDLRPEQPAVAASARPPAPGRLGAARPASLDTPQEDVSPVGTVQGVNIFAVDQIGVMAFIRRTNLHIERRLQLAATTGRTPDGMQHLGAALHSVEDLFAHSNYIEIAVNQLVRSDPAFLQSLTGSERQVFTYSASVRLGGSQGRPAEDRPVLTTGSFTGTDTQVSIASELVGFLSRPLPPPATREEQDAQERFVLALLRNFDAQMSNNPQLRQTVRQSLIRAGVPPLLASQADQIPLADVYEMKTFFRIHIPDWIRVPIKTAINEAVSNNVLQPRARQLQAAALNARIVDTSLIQVLRDSQRQQSGVFTDTEIRAMDERARTIGPPRAQQEAEARASGQRRADAIRATPLPVVAGPSHSQIAKDHPNSPFFGLAVLLASVAVQRLRDRMLAVWNERQGSPTQPYSFDWSHFPPAAPAGASQADIDAYEGGRRLYHVGRPARGHEMRESLQSGQEIIAQGGSPGQPYDLATIRSQAAQQIRDVANALRAMAGAPGAVQSGLTRFRTLVGSLSPEMQEHIGGAIDRAIAASRAAGGGRPVANLNTVAASLTNVATPIENARTHDERERANAALVQQRQNMLNALASSPGLDRGLAVALLYTLDEQIRTTAVAYSSEQRAVLEGRARVTEMGTSPAGLTVATVTLPAPPTGSSPAMIALITEARLLMNHPYENRWWETYVRDYARRFPDRLINDIEARNEGVPFYPAGPGGGGHNH